MTKKKTKATTKAPRKTKVPPAFAARAKAAQAMTPAERKAWAKRMQEARAAKKNPPKDKTRAKTKTNPPPLRHVGSYDVSVDGSMREARIMVASDGRWTLDDGDGRGATAFAEGDKGGKRAAFAMAQRDRHRVGRIYDVERARFIPDIVSERRRRGT